MKLIVTLVLKLLTLLLHQKVKMLSTVSSLSKAYGLPGLRMGWLISKDEILMEQFLAAKEMIYISNSAIDEEVAYQFYLQKEKFAKAINAKAMQNFELLKQWLRGRKKIGMYFTKRWCCLLSKI